MLSFIPQILQFGIIAGVVMSIVAMALNMIGFTKLDLGQYLGCLLTGQKSGAASSVAGTAMHLALSGAFAYLYVQAMAYFNLLVTLQTALILGAANTILSGIMLKVTDAINPCIASKKVRAMGLFA